MKSMMLRSAATLFVAAGALVWSGCATAPTQKSEAPPTKGGQWPIDGGKAAAAKPAPAPAPVVAKPAVVLPKSNTVEIVTESVRLTKTVPATTSLGSDYTSDIVVTALVNVGGIVVVDTLPDGATYVSSTPAAVVNGKQLTWSLGETAKGATQKIAVVTKADKEGELTNCVTVTAIPKGCVTTVVGQPVLTIAKTGPAKAVLNSTVTYTIVVTNTGSMAANDVVVTDTLPEGLVSADGKKVLTFALGSLAPKESRSIPVAVKAAKTGNLCNPASAHASNVAKDVAAQACTEVVEPKLTVEKTGTKEQNLGRNADYSIVVANPGTSAVTNVVVTDTIPAGTRVVTAGNNGVVSGNLVTWKFATLNPGDKQTVTLTLTSATPGTLCNKVGAASAEGLNANAEACTLWKGVSGILLEKLDTLDPILVGATTDLVAKITNQGSADDTNVKLVITLPAELTPVAVVDAESSTKGTINGQTVSFESVPKLAPGAAVKFRITAKGAKAGDARTKFTLTSDGTAPTPVEASESTHVY